MSDEITRVRQFERQLDAYPQTLRVFTVPLGQVIWHLLLAHEHEFQRRIRGAPVSDCVLVADELKKGLKHALDWAHKHCQLGSSPFIPTFSKTTYNEALDLLLLGVAYQPICCMYSMMKNKRRLVTALVDNDGNLHMDYDPTQMQYEALSHISKARSSETRMNALITNDTLVKQFRLAMSQVFDRSELVPPGIVKASFNKSEYSSVKAIIEKVRIDSHHFPDNWQFRNISISEFRIAFLSLLTLATLDSLIHREYMFNQYSPGNGYNILESFLWKGNIDELMHRIIPFEPDISKSALKTILEFVIYNSRLEKRDPALQPIVPHKQLLIIAPSLIQYSNLERNLIALLAREYKNEYDNTTSVLEPALIAELSAALRDRGFEVRTNLRIPDRKDLPDIDLFAYEPKCNKLILGEVKWMIEPGEPGEQLTRADAEEKAIIDQLRPIVDYAKKNKSLLLSAASLCHTDIPDKNIHGFLFIRGFSGMWHEFAEQYSTIEADHFLNAAASSKSNNKLIDWMINREYLPILGTDYRIEPIPIKFGPFTVIIAAVKTCQTG